MHDSNDSSKKIVVTFLVIGTVMRLIRAYLQSTDHEMLRTYISGVGFGKKLPKN